MEPLSEIRRQTGEKEQVMPQMRLWSIHGKARKQMDVWHLSLLRIYYWKINIINYKLTLVLVFLSILNIVNAQEIEYDKYDCIAEKLLEECANKEIWTPGNNAQILNGEGRNIGFLKAYIIQEEEKFLKQRKGVIDIGTIHHILLCKFANKPFDENKDEILSYYIDHFLWKGSTIDCAWVRQDYNVSIGNVNFAGTCPIMVIGNENTINPSCKNSTYNFSVGEVTLLSLGGLTLFGFGVHFLLNYIKNYRKNKES